MGIIKVVRASDLTSRLKPGLCIYHDKRKPEMFLTKSCQKFNLIGADARCAGNQIGQAMLERRIFDDGELDRYVVRAER